MHTLQVGWFHVSIGFLIGFSLLPHDSITVFPQCSYRSDMISLWLSCCFPLGLLL